jgi:hypothetical protein
MRNNSLFNSRRYMHKIFTFLLLALAFGFVSCNGSKHSVGTSTDQFPVVKDQEGTSYENAVFITEKTESKGVDAEYKWLSQHYPGYKLKKQSLGHNGGKPYDLMDIKTSSGEEKTIYFDISNFFGNL